MATNKLEICNDALMLLGAQPLTSAELAANTLDRAKLVNQYYDKCRKWVWKGHPWKSGCVVDRLFAYQPSPPGVAVTPGVGATVAGNTGVSFTTVAPFFVDAATDVGKQIVRTDGPGRAIVTGFTDTLNVTTTILQAFANLSPVTNWRYYNQIPDHTWAFTILLPTGFMRFKDIDQYATENYRMIAPGDRLASSHEAIDIVYIKDETDTTKFEPLFEEALQAYLASRIALPLTGALAVMKAMLELYQMKLAEARTMDSQQGTPDDVGTNILARVRYTGMGPDRSQGNL